MEMVDKIIKHPKFSRYIRMNAAAEQNRKFCHHDIQHAVDVARVAYIMALENSYNIKKETIYVAALLHDIAKWKQYTEGVDHAHEGAILAKEILEDLGMDESETEIILDAIQKHRKRCDKNSLLGSLLYAGDKACRICTMCSVINECNRFSDGKEPELKY